MYLKAWPQEEGGGEGRGQPGCCTNPIASRIIPVGMHDSFPIPAPLPLPLPLLVHVLLTSPVQWLRPLLEHPLLPQPLPLPLLVHALLT